MKFNEILKKYNCVGSGSSIITQVLLNLRIQVSEFVQCNVYHRVSCNLGRERKERRE